VSSCAPGQVTDPEQPPAPQASSKDPELWDLIWIGTACAIAIVGAGAGGYALDSWLGTTPWLTFAGLAFGIVSAVLLCVAELRKFT
jgi:Putative F0F1-ATPase subunit Ca2+/Mg2+ transporter